MKEIKKYFHAIKIEKDKCTGCTCCVRVCPTEALRVRKGKIELDESRCIDCGKCIKACKFGALVPIFDKFDIIHNFKHKLAIIDYPFAGQFNKEFSYRQAKETLLDLGFDEVATAAEVTKFMSTMIRDQIDKNPTIKPIISSNCPAVVRLIQVRFPSLLPNVLSIEAPMSLLSKYYKDKICKIKNLDESDIGVFLIVPCIAQVTAVHQPEGAYKRIQDGAFAINDIYNKIMTKANEKDYLATNIAISKGHSWAISSLEAEEVEEGEIDVLSVNGIQNVINILTKIENHQIETFDYVVLKSCTNGCVGGLLNVENPFVATSRIKKLMTEQYDNTLDEEYFFNLYERGNFDIVPLEPRSIMELDKDIKQAIQKMKKLREIEAMLPGLDCSACGSPSCASLAEDIIHGKATLDDCVVLLKKHKEHF